jgi:hypothetical protein
VRGGSAATEGMYASADKGKTWTDYNAGMTDSKEIRTMWISRLSGYMFVTPFFGGGIWKTTATVGTPLVSGLFYPADYSDKFSLSISPNPSSQDAVVDYYLASSDRVSMQVFDEQGKLVQVLMNEQTQSSGDQSYRFNVSTFQPGMYYLHISSGKEKTVKKFVVGK